MIKIIGYKNFILISSFVAGLLFLSQAAAQHQWSAQRKPNDFDRLDGRGKSGKKVDVVEFAGNLEIHVYPGGSTLGLSIRIDRKKKKKPVAVIAYRFNTNANDPLIRRAILTVPLNDNFRVYQDKKVSEYDKFIVTNHDLGNQLAKVKLDPPPKHMHPKGHPERLPTKKLAEDDKRTPAKTNRDLSNEQKAPVDENGAIQHFSW